MALVKASISLVQCLRFPHPIILLPTPPLLLGVYSPTVVGQLARRFAQRMTIEGQKYFIYYSMILPHDRIDAPPGTSHDSPQEGFENQIEYLDGLVGEVGGAWMHLP